MTLDSCGEGLNLCGANHVVFVGMSRKPGLMEQGEDRAHRKGATKPVTCSWLFAENTRDAYVLEALQKKAGVNGRVLDGDGDSALVFHHIVTEQGHAANTQTRSIPASRTTMSIPPGVTVSCGK